MTAPRDRPLDLDFCSMIELIFEGADLAWLQFANEGLLSVQAAWAHAKRC